MTDIERLVTDALRAETVEQFRPRVDEQAADLREAIAAGEFDNGGFAIGLEMEVYAVDEQGRLVELPEEVFEGHPNKELGVHNAELNTDPDVLDAGGLRTQARSIRESVVAAQERVGETDRELVLDAMWTVPPTEGSQEYLGATYAEGSVSVAANMRPDPRYIAIDTDIREHAGGEVPLSVPGADVTFPTILYESLATSIQPHLQIPDSERFPDYYNAAIRTLGPLLALSSNSPFLPPDLYDAADPQDLVERTHHELRIAVFEQSVNHTPAPKVRVPADIDDTTDVVDRVVADDLVAPFLREWLEDGDREALHQRVWEFDYKRSTYWRWLRCVVGGDPVGGGDERSLRIEYRPLPTQPTVTDVVGMQALTVGLIRGLVAADHPLAELPWQAAEDSFYAAAEDGIDADLAWLTADGQRTDDHGTIFAEVFDYARRGLRAANLPDDDIDDYLAPIEARLEAGTTPSVWKKEQVARRLDDGASLADAITGMQREYDRLRRETDSFAEWL